MLKNVLEYLEQTVEQVPDRLAFADEAHTLTFSELYQAGRSIGTALARRTACHNRPIVVLVERSAMTVAAMLGVLYSVKLRRAAQAEAPAAEPAEIEIFEFPVEVA